MTMAGRFRASSKSLPAREVVEFKGDLVHKKKSREATGLARCHSLPARVGLAAWQFATGRMCRLESSRITIRRSDPICAMGA
jgi:hypothetical protein